MDYEQPPTRPACGHENLHARYEMVFGQKQASRTTLASITCATCGDVLYRPTEEMR